MFVCKTPVPTTTSHIQIRNWNGPCLPRSRPEMSEPTLLLTPITTTATLDVIAMPFPSLTIPSSRMQRSGKVVSYSELLKMCNWWPFRLWRLPTCLKAGDFLENSDGDSSGMLPRPLIQAGTQRFGTRRFGTNFYHIFAYLQSPLTRKRLWKCQSGEGCMHPGF